MEHQLVLPGRELGSLQQRAVAAAVAVGRHGLEQRTRAVGRAGTARSPSRPPGGRSRYRGRGWSGGHRACRSSSSCHLPPGGAALPDVLVINHGRWHAKCSGGPKHLQSKDEASPRPRGRGADGAAAFLSTALTPAPLVRSARPSEQAQSEAAQARGISLAAWHRKPMPGRGVRAAHGQRRASRRQQALRHHARRRRCQPQDPRRQLLLPAGAVRLRQDQHAAHDRRPRGDQRGRRHDRRPRSSTTCRRCSAARR